jgi:hypothetical protein
MQFDAEGLSYRQRCYINLFIEVVILRYVLKIHRPTLGLDFNQTVRGKLNLVGADALPPQTPNVMKSHPVPGEPFYCTNTRPGRLKPRNSPSDVFNDVSVKQKLRRY